MSTVNDGKEGSDRASTVGYGENAPVTLERCASMRLLRDRMAASGGGRLLGGAQEHPSRFWLGRSPLWPDTSLGPTAVAGTLAPEFARSWRDPSLLLVGYNRNVRLLRLLRLDILADHSQFTVFFTFLLTDPAGPLIAILEAEVMAFHWNGHVLWHHLSDILTEWSIAGGHLSLREFHGSALTVDLARARARTRLTGRNDRAEYGRVHLFPPRVATSSSCPLSPTLGVWCVQGCLVRTRFARMPALVADYVLRGLACTNRL
jgi:hypothetical protein